MRKIKWFILVLLTCVLSVYAAFWWIAKEEIYYLCGNFTKGIDQTSVIRQLETASLSHYSLHDLPRGIPQDATIDDNVRQEILFSSNIHLSFYQCAIQVDKNGKVITAQFSQPI